MSTGWRWVAALAIGGGAYLVLRDELPQPGEIWATITNVNPAWLAVAVAAEAISMATFARLFRRLLGLGGTKISLGRALAVTYARNAFSNSLPAGPVLSIAYTTREFSRLGAGRPLIAATLVLAAFYSGVTFGVLSLVALLGSPATRIPTLIAALAVVALAAMVMRTRPFVGVVRRRMPKLSAQLDAARAAIRPASRDRAILAGLALLNWLLDVACLVAVCVAVGVDIGPHTMLLGYVAAKGAQALALIPGGLGVVEIGMAATFFAAGASGGAAGAVVALYRLISYWAILIAGWLAWAFLHDEVRAAAKVVGRFLMRAGASMSPFALPPTERGAHP
ncbi:YbhN family protein [Acrocarpospora sp. B8E8]|uniref:lysylphosphatidylglycerol synthase transmembrane domain-containing protein n=1 Tax=Acrocarpospora sp. B8E8 TaxID=3153572 RepID=UPI00325CA15F